MSDSHALAALVDRLADAHVLCVGDVMLDHFVRGTVERISPEAPIPVLRVDETRSDSMLGGVGNVASNVAALGGRAVLVAVVGQDESGHILGRIARGIAGVDSELVVDPVRRTTVKERFVARSQQMLRVDRETVGPVAQEIEEKLLAAVERHVGACQAVILSDYGKGVLSDGVLRRVIDRATALGLPVVIDPFGPDYARYRGAGIVSPNRAELRLASGEACVDSEEIVAAARALIARCGIATMLVTRSEDGMSLIERNGVATHLAAEAREVVDVSGAGDTVVATVAAALAVGADRATAAALANIAAGVVVQKSGTAVTYPEEIVAALHESEIRASDAKIKPLTAAVRVVEGWRRSGKRIGFTNGTFDLLHPGHLASIRQARAACDRLVVGLNSDASVKRYKGPTRPVQGEAARALVLASLEPIDLVVIFDDDTPIKLIQTLRPDVLVKGAQYQVDQVVGADLVQSYGGKVLLAEMVDGQSTTETIARMAKK